MTSRKPPRLHKKRKNRRQRRSSCLQEFRRINFETLEERQLLATITDGFESVIVRDTGTSISTEGPVGGEATNDPTPGDGTPAQHAEQFRQQQYFPQGEYQGATDGYLSHPTSGAPIDVAMRYLEDHAEDFGLTASDLEDYSISSQHTDANNGVTHIYLQQEFNGLDVFNARANVSVDGLGRVLSAGSTFVPGLVDPANPQTVSPSITAVEAVETFANTFGFEAETSTIEQVSPTHHQYHLLSPSGVSTESIPAKLEYVATPAGLELAWRIEIQTTDQQHWYVSHVSTGQNEVRNLIDYVANFSYNVFPMPLESPNDGDREIVVDPHDLSASPFGWHDTNGAPGSEFTDTRGNNVFAQEDHDGDDVLGARALGGPALEFDDPLDLTLDPLSYTEASVTNLFYWNNVIHDVLYHYGFTEAAGNFQATNYTGQGLPGDEVIADAQDDFFNGSVNNANFATPPDGQSGRMQMFLTDTSNPFRDTDLDNGVILHEYGHGVSNRLTGGGLDAGALQDDQARSLGEGWSDFFGLMFTQLETDLPGDAYPIGSYSLIGAEPGDEPLGIRDFPYSFDIEVQPKTWVDYEAGLPRGPHFNGEIWGAALWDLNWLLIEEYGFDADLYTGTGGNNLTMQLVMDGMKLQPVQPSYLDARDAILAADQAMTGGLHTFEIWTAFSRRGMGFSALDGDGNDEDIAPAFDMPDFPSSITGQVFADENINGILDPTEEGVSNVTVFIDSDNDGSLDPFEPRTQTDVNGDYEFVQFTSGVFTVAAILPSGFSQTTPLDPNSHTVFLAPGQTVGDLNFGLATGQPLSDGGVFHDLNEDGVRDANEEGLSGFFVYVDLNNNGSVDFNEPSDISAADGSFTLGIEGEGDFVIRQQAPAGWTQTYPADNMGHLVTIGPGVSVGDLQFGNAGQLMDFGDSPAPYPVTIEEDGARYGFLAGFQLGALLDGEGNGVHTVNSDGDDTNSLPDEDGVVVSNLFVGQSATADVTVNIGNYPRGYLQMFLDFNRDGDWDDANEQVIADARIGRNADDPSGQCVLVNANTDTYQCTISVPDSAQPGPTQLLTRYGWELGIGSTGPGMAGEVEAYELNILGGDPDAIDDQLEVDQDSTLNTLDVLANDLPSFNGPLSIFAINGQPGPITTQNAGSLSIAIDGQSLIYTPAAGRFGIDQFTYTVTDPNGNTDTAAVTINIRPTFTAPVAVDDHFMDVGPNANTLDVLQNDIPGQNPPITIDSFTQPENGTVAIAQGGQALIYTPNDQFTNLDQFTYTVRDDVGTDCPNNRCTATVSVQVDQNGDPAPDPSDDDLVKLSFTVTSVEDLTTPIESIGSGEIFSLNVFYDDLRDADPLPSPPGPDGVDESGVYAAYQDILFDPQLAQPVRVSGGLGLDITFSQAYSNVVFADPSTPGVIEEVGATQSPNVPLGQDAILAYSIRFQAVGTGPLTFTGDPADIRSDLPPDFDPAHDTLLFQFDGDTPADPSDDQVVPVKRITYDEVTLNIVPEGTPPIAVDDSFQEGVTTLDVLKNDLAGSNGLPTILNFGPTSHGGTVTVSQDNLSLIYQRVVPGVTETFTYTIQDPLGLQSTANVTIHGTQSDDVLGISFAASDLVGNPLTDAEGNQTGTILAGDDFLINIFVDDLREEDPIPLTTQDDRGVFAGFFDLLYDNGILSPVTGAGGLIFDPIFGNQQSSDFSVVGIVDELGAFSTSNTPLGGDPRLLASLRVTATNVGQVEVKADPADVRSDVPPNDPSHDSLLFEFLGDDFGDPSDDQVVPIHQITFGTMLLEVTATTNNFNGGEGENAFTNPDNSRDTNADGFVSAIDVLKLINDVNLHGVRDLNGSAAAGESAMQAVAPQDYFPDVNGDGHLTPLDAALVIDYINMSSASASEGEANAVLPESQRLTAQRVVADPRALIDLTEDANETALPESDSFVIEVQATNPEKAFPAVPVLGNVAQAKDAKVLQPATEDADEDLWADPLIPDDLAADIFGAWLGNKHRDS